MTQDKNFKRRVRDLAKAEGLTYTAALHRLRREAKSKPDQKPPDDPRQPWTQSGRHG